MAQPEAFIICETMEVEHAAQPFLALSERSRDKIEELGITRTAGRAPFGQGTKGIGADGAEEGVARALLWPMAVRRDGS